MGLDLGDSRLDTFRIDAPRLRRVRPLLMLSRLQAAIARRRRGHRSHRAGPEASDIAISREIFPEIIASRILGRDAPQPTQSRYAAARSASLKGSRP
jgi:hypothetical protein